MAVSSPSSSSEAPGQPPPCLRAFWAPFSSAFCPHNIKKKSRSRERRRRHDTTRTQFSTCFSPRLRSDQVRACVVSPSLLRRAGPPRPDRGLFRSDISRHVVFPIGTGVAWSGPRVSFATRRVSGAKRGCLARLHRRTSFLLPPRGTGTKTKTFVPPTVGWKARG